MTSRHEEVTQPNQTIASESQNNGRPELKVKVIPPAYSPWTLVSKPVIAVFSSIRTVAGQSFWDSPPTSSPIPTLSTQGVVLNNIKDLRESITRRVKEFDPKEKDLPESLQTEIPKLAVLIQKIERLALRSNHRKKLSSLNSLVCSLEVELDSLFQKKLNKEFIRQIRLDVEREVIKHERTPCNQEVVLDNIRNLREIIAEEVKGFDQKEKDLPKNLQTEIPKLAVLLQRIERLVLGSNRRKKLSSLNSLVGSLDVALASLSQKKLNKEFTRQIRLDIEREIIKHEHLPIIGLIVNLFVYTWHAKSVRLSVLYGLSWSFFIMFGGFFLLAFFQYADYTSGVTKTAKAEIVNLETLIDKEKKELKNLDGKLESAITPQSAKEVSRSPANGNGTTSEDENAAVRANKQANLRSLQEGIEESRAKMLKLEEQRDSIQSKQSSLQTFVSSSIPLNVDVEFSKTLSQILWVAAAGTLGSIVSILIRVIGESYGKKTYDDPLTPFFIGFFKPVIGASFGVLFLAFLNSGVVSTPLIPGSSKAPSTNQAAKDSNSPETRAAFFLFSVAFVVGFSERLAKDTITKLEGSSGEGNESVKENNSRVVVIRVGTPVTRGNRIQSSSEFRKVDRSENV